jgi:hypothetical protein
MDLCLNAPTPLLPMLLMCRQCATGYPRVGSVFFGPVEREMPAARLPLHHARRWPPFVPCPSPSAVTRGGLRGVVRVERIEGREWRNEWRRQEAVGWVGWGRRIRPHAGGRCEVGWGPYLLPCVAPNAHDECLSLPCTSKIMDGNFFILDLYGKKFAVCQTRNT